ncbi:hypothetical protein ACFOG5_18030 [Pedobacter fastidiosus]
MPLLPMCGETPQPKFFGIKLNIYKSDYYNNYMFWHNYETLASIVTNIKF